MTINFHTKIKLKQSENSISYKSKLFFIGSCFSENMGKLLQLNKFPISINPFGILYNPLSISQNLETLLGNKNYDESDLFFHEGL